MKPTLVLQAPVGRVARRVFDSCYKAMCAAVDFRHAVKIHVVPSRVVGDQPPFGRLHGVGFGAFAIRRGKPSIWIAGIRQEGCITDDEHREMLLRVLCHELAHYEQWRDGKRLQERGVGVRARSLMKKIGGVR